MDIEYTKLPSKADKEYLEMIEKELKDKAVLLEKEIMRLRAELQNLTKLHQKVASNIKEEKKKETTTNRDEVCSYSFIFKSLPFNYL